MGSKASPDNPLKNPQKIMNFLSSLGGRPIFPQFSGFATVPLTIARECRRSDELVMLQPHEDRTVTAHSRLWNPSSVNVHGSREEGVARRQSHGLRSRMPSRLALAFVVATAAVAFGPARPAAAQSGWLPTSWFSSGEIDPSAMFPLAENDGPWLVLASTFRGESAREDARSLVHELRGRYKLEAYTLEKSFDYTGEQAGLGFNPDGTPKRMRYANAAEVTEVAVLVGDFSSYDDPRGQKMLTKIKSLRPESLSDGKAKSRSFSDFRRMIGMEGNGAKGPMHMAFVIPNPLLPEEFFSRPEVDDFVLEMNSGVEHCLLDCQGRYSVRVALFTGAGTFDQKAIENGENLELESRLVEAAETAHRLTESLRRRGFEAWEFHDRESSMVCVGSFQQLTVPGADGRQVIHPGIAKVVEKLGADPEKLAQGQILPRTIDGVLLEIQPKPVDVPRMPANRRR